MAFHIVRNDIVKMKADAIVNSANPMPTYAYGADRAIYEAAGAAELLKERKQIGEIKPGEAAATFAGKLKAKYVIHTVGPLWEGGNHGEFEILRDCYENSLRLAGSKHCKSIAFPLISTGVDGFPKDKALDVAMSTIHKYLMHNQMDVYLVVFDEKSFVLTGKIYDEIQACIDSEYVDAARGAEYKLPSDRIDMGSEDEALRYETMKSLEVRSHRTAFEMQSPVRSEAHKDMFDLNPSDISTGGEMTFQEKMLEYMDRGRLKPSEIYHPIGMSRQHFSKILNNRYYKPNKNTALLLAIVLHLNIEETKDFLSRADYAFNPCSRQDKVVKACLQNKQYDFAVIDAMMQRNHLDTLINYEGKKMSPAG